MHGVVWHPRRLLQNTIPNADSPTIATPQISRRAAGRRQLIGSSGIHDDYNLHWGHRLLSHYLHEAGIAHEHRENPGNRGGRANESYQVALQWLGQVLDTD